VVAALQFAGESKMAAYALRFAPIAQTLFARSAKARVARRLAWVAALRHADQPVFG